MRDLFKSPKQDFVETIRLALRAVAIILLLIIAYNTSYLRSIFQELARMNQEKQFVVNVNNTVPSVSNPAQGPLPKSAPSLSTQPSPHPQKTSTGQAASPAQKSAKSNSSAPKKPEPNLNPTTHKVEMLNNSPEGAMVFSPPYLQIKAGDSVEFLPASYGHNVQTPEEIIGNTHAIPKNAKPFKGAMNEKLIVKFTEPGIYLYVCNYHYIVGHVGVIQVGNDSHNLDTVREAGTLLKGKIFSHPDRVDKYLDMVKTY